MEESENVGEEVSGATAAARAVVYSTRYRRSKPALQVLERR